MGVPKGFPVPVREVVQFSCGCEFITEIATKEVRLESCKPTCLLVKWTLKTADEVGQDNVEVREA